MWSGSTLASARTAPSTTAKMATMTVIGCRSAKTIGFIDGSHVVWSCSAARAIMITWATPGNYDGKVKAVLGFDRLFPVRRCGRLSRGGDDVAFCGSARGRGLRPRGGTG